MSRLRPISFVIILLCAGLLGWQRAHRKPAEPAVALAGPEKEAERAPMNPAGVLPNREPGLRPATAEDLADRTATSTPPSGRLQGTPPETPQVPETPESSTLPAETVLQNLRISFRQYASTFGENPVGTNLEITSALQGHNARQMNFLKADGNRVNANGELVDVWGTPYFFHQLSGHEMEIRSAGPDRIMYTGDDLVTR
jgi:hypothetical protein